MCNCIEIIVRFWHILQETYTQICTGLSVHLSEQNDFVSHGRTDRWLGSFQTGIPGTELCARVCVYHGIPLNRYTTPTHTHTSPSALLQYVSLTHTSIQKPTLQNTNIWCCIPMTENCGTRLGPSLPLQSSSGTYTRSKDRSLEVNPFRRIVLLWCG